MSLKKEEAKIQITPSKFNWNSFKSLNFTFFPIESSKLRIFSTEVFCPISLKKICLSMQITNEKIFLENKFP